MHGGLEIARLSVQHICASDQHTDDAWFKNCKQSERQTGMWLFLVDRDLQLSGK